MSRSHEFDNKTPASVKAEVDRLIREGKYQLSPAEAVKLREKFKDSAMFELVMEHLNESHHKILNVAKKYYKYAQTQLLGGNKTIDYILRQAVPFAKKVPLTDAEIDAFRRLVEDMIEGKIPNETSTYRHISSVGSLFGVSSVEQVESMKDNLSSGDFAKIQDIVRLESENKALYQQIVLQSVQYQDCDIMALSGKFDQERHNPMAHVHPLIAALYLPKFDILDRTTLHSHLAGIVRARYNREPLLNQVDKELFDNIIYTNRREVCSMNPAEDLYRRVKLQYALWENVIALRTGRYYNINSNLVNALDQCHLTHVSPSNTVVNDEGASARRIFGSFGLNTILFKLSANPQMMAANVNLGASLFVPTTVQEERASYDAIITIDMADHKTRNGAPYNFKDALSQNTYYLDERDRYISVQTDVVAVYKLMTFYVPRRKTAVMQRQTIGQNSIASQLQISFNQLPLTISGLSELNSYPVIAPNLIPINNTFMLRKRSVLVTETVVYQSPSDPTNMAELVTSTSAIIYADSGEVYYYNPTGVVQTVSGTYKGPGTHGDHGVPVVGDSKLAAEKYENINVYGRPDPFSTIAESGPEDGTSLNAQYLESKQGTLFFYQTTD